MNPGNDSFDRNEKKLSIGDTVLCRQGQHSGKRRMVISSIDVRPSEVYLDRLCLETQKPARWLASGVEKQ